MNPHLKSLRTQRGMTGLGWLTVLALIGFFALLGLNLVPIYLDHYSVVSTLKSLEKEPFITKKSPSEIHKMLNKRFDMNYVTGLPKDAVQIKKGGGVLTVKINYQVKKKFVGNIDFLVSFDDNIRLVSH